MPLTLFLCSSLITINLYLQIERTNVAIHSWCYVEQEMCQQLIGDLKHTRKLIFHVWRYSFFQWWKSLESTPGYVLKFFFDCIRGEMANQEALEPQGEMDLM